MRSGQEARLNQIQQQLANANERESQLNQVLLFLLVLSSYLSCDHTINWF
jgi:hypothetical protein